VSFSSRCAGHMTAWLLYRPSVHVDFAFLDDVAHLAQVLGDTQDADFPIFRNNTGKVRAPRPALMLLVACDTTKDTGVITVSTTVFDLKDGSVKVSHSPYVSCAHAVEPHGTPCPLPVPRIIPSSSFFMFRCMRVGTPKSTPTLRRSCCSCSRVI
jgi:hypothetical protein